MLTELIVAVQEGDEAARDELLRVFGQAHLNAMARADQLQTLVESLVGMLAEANEPATREYARRLRLQIDQVVADYPLPGDADPGSANGTEPNENAERE